MLQRSAPLFVALAVALSAPAARALVYSFDTPISGDPVAVTVELADAPGGVDIAVSIAPGQGDLLGFFANLSDESLLPSLDLEDPSGAVSQWQFAANQVWKVGGGNSMAPVKRWDLGLLLGENGSPGGVAVESASFRLTAPGLTTAQLTGAANQGWVFGVRIQGTLGAEGSAKIGMPEGTPPVGVPPSIAITSPPDGALLAASPVLFDGSVSGTDPLVDVEGTPAQVLEEAWSVNLALADGTHLVTATAVNDLGSAGDSVTVTVDTLPPSLAIATPADGSLTSLAEIEVVGTAADASGIAAVTVNGVAASLSGTSFTATVPLALGENAISVLAQDAAGHVSTAEVRVTRGDPPEIAIATPADGALLAVSRLPSLDQLRQ